MTSVPHRVSGTLPAGLTSFVGRRRELAEIRRSFGSTRLLTLTGVGGVGKTRLALRAAETVGRTFTDGVWLVELADLATPELLADRVASVFGLAGTPEAQPWADLEAFVADRHLLVVLDNCEHLLDAAAVLAQRLLSVSGGLRILATSRQPLGMFGERALAVAPLAVPDGRGVVRPEVLDHYDAVALFVDRARAVRPEFRLTDDNCAAVVRLCDQLDGIPLAIELAAARLRACSPHQLVELLTDRFAVLTTGNRTGPPRQQTLRAMVDWSFELCTDRERTLWQRLSVFADGFTLAAAEDVCPGAGLATAAVADTLAALIDKSVVTRIDHGQAPRYRMLETIRQYGLRRLTEAGAYAEVGRRHRDWCGRLIAAADVGWVGPDQVGWYDRVRRERANLQAALRFCLEEEDDGQAAVDLAASLCIHRRACASLVEGRRWLDHVLGRVPQPSPARAKALWVNAWLALLQGDTAAARALLDECRDVARTTGDREAMAYAVQFFALADLFDGDAVAAVAGLRDAVARHRELDLGEHSRVAELQLKMACCFARDPEAGAVVRAARESWRGSPPSITQAYLAWFASLVDVLGGDRPAAAEPAADALRVAAAAGDRWLESLCLETIAWSVCAAGDHARAARLLGAAETTRTEIGARLSGLAHLHPPHDLAVRAARAGLGDEAFDAGFRAGAALTGEQAVALGLGGPAAAVPSPPAVSPLTRREREVADLVAKGLSNKEIAATLVITIRTAQTHVSHILTKLGFTSRAQIAAWVAEGASLVR